MGRYSGLTRFSSRWGRLNSSAALTVKSSNFRDTLNDTSDKPVIVGANKSGTKTEDDDGDHNYTGENKTNLVVFCCTLILQ